MRQRRRWSGPVAQERCFVLRSAVPSHPIDYMVEKGGRAALHQVHLKSSIGGPP
jgi:hypothetical protein